MIQRATRNNRAPEAEAPGAGSSSGSNVAAVGAPARRVRAWAVLRWIGPLLALGVLEMVIDNDYVKSLLVSVLILSIATMSLTVLFGWAGQVSLLTAALILAGGYVGYFADVVGVGFAVGAVLAAATGALIGLLTSLPALRLSGIYLLLATIAVHFIIVDTGNLLQSTTGNPAGYFLPVATIAGVTVSSTTSWMWLSALVCLAVWRYYEYLRGTRMVRAWRTVGEDAEAAGVIGIDTSRAIMSAFAVTSCITAVSGFLLAYFVRNVSYEAYDIFSAIDFLMAIVIGGIGSLGGAVIGIAIVRALPALIVNLTGSGSGTGWLPANLAYLQIALYGLIGAVVLVFAPDGVGPGLRRAWGRTLRSGGKLLRRRASGRGRRRAETRLPEGELLRLEDVSAEYGGTDIALRDINWTIPQGATTSIVGRNGSGKTTLLFTIVGFPPGTDGRLVDGAAWWRNADGDAGTVRLDSENTRRRVRRGIIFIPAEDKVFPDLTVEEHLREAMAGRRHPGEQGASRVSEVFDLFPVLADRRAIAARLLSGGERQQLALACAIIKGARLLMVDEASLGLAPALAKDALGALVAAKERSGATLVLVEQSISAAFSLGDQVSMVEDGRIVRHGAPTDDYRHAVESHLVGDASAEHVDTAVGTSRRTSATPVPSGALPVTGTDTVGSHTEPAVAMAGVSLRIGGIRAVTDLDLEVSRGSVLGLIGPNGSGKSSVLNMLNGYYRPTSGRISLLGSDIQSMAPDDIAALGVGRSFQAVGHIGSMTMLEYVAVGFERTWRDSMTGVLVGRGRRSERACRSDAQALLRVAGLEDAAGKMLTQASYGMRKLADIARAFAAEPELVLLDEPTSGLSKDNRERMRAVVARYRQLTGASLVIVDHDMEFIRGVCDSVVVLAAGSEMARGTPPDVLSQRDVIEILTG